MKDSHFASGPRVDPIILSFHLESSKASDKGKLVAKAKALEKKTVKRVTYKFSSVASRAGEFQIVTVYDTDMVIDNFSITVQALQSMRRSMQLQYAPPHGKTVYSVAGLLDVIQELSMRKLLLPSGSHDK